MEIRGREIELAGQKYVFGTFRDISERKQWEEKLQESEKLHRITIENISDPIFITDDDGRFTFICPNVMHKLGYTDAEVWALGRIDQLFDPLLDAPEFLASGEVHNLERVISDKHGHPHNFLISAKRVSIKDGTILFTCHDITELKKRQLPCAKQRPVCAVW